MTELLPPGWRNTTIGAVASVVTGRTPPTSDLALFGGGIPFAKPGDLDNVDILVTSATTLAPKGLELVPRLPAGSVLVSCIGNLGKTAVLGRDGSCNQQINAILPTPEALPKFLFYWAKTIRPWMDENASGTTITILNKGRFLLAPLLLPWIDEQRRIVAKLDDVLARSRRAKQALDAVPPLLEKLRQSILAAAFRGDLTADWRATHPDVEPADALLARIRVERRKKWEEAELAKMKAKGKPPSDDRWKAKYKEPNAPVFLDGQRLLPRGWAWASVSYLTDCLDAQREPITRDKRKTGPYPYFGANGRVDSIADYIFDEPLVLVTEDETFYGRTKPIAYQVDGKCWVNNHAHVLRCVPPISPRFMCQTLMYYPVVRWLSGTTGRAKLTQGALNTLPVALPPLLEVAEIEKRLARALLAEANIVSHLRDARERDEQLSAVLLAKAFRGELVPHERSEAVSQEIAERSAVLGPNVR